MVETGLTLQRSARRGGGTGVPPAAIRVSGRRRHCFVAFVIIALAMSSPVSAQLVPLVPLPAPPPAAGDPPMLRFPLAEVCQLRVRDNMLVFSTKVAFSGRTAREVDVVGLAGTTYISYRPYRFSLENSRDAEDGKRISTSIERSRTYFRLQRTITDGPNDRAIAFVQSYVDDDTIRMKPGHVRLTVSLNGDLLESVDSDDFAALRRDRPRAFYRELLPIIRELGGEAVLNVDPWVARQALGDRPGADEVAGFVARRVGELNDPAFKVRDEAMHRLAGLGADGLAELKKFDPDDLSAQQSLAVEVLLTRHQPIPRTEADHLRDDLDFVLDCLYADEADVLTRATARLKELTGRASKIDLAIPPAHRAKAIEAFRAELTARATTQPATTRPAVTRPTTQAETN